MKKKIDFPVRYLKGIGPRRAASLGKAGVLNVLDLLYYFPRRYEDRRNFKTISSLEEGQVQTIRVKIAKTGYRHSLRRRNFSILEALAEDQSGKLSCVWFNQPYLKDRLPAGTDLILYGKVERYGAKLQISNPEFEIITEDSKESLHIGRITPIYTLAEGISQRSFRQIMKNTLDEYTVLINDFLPYDIRLRNKLGNLAFSLNEIHFPKDFDSREQAYRRLSFEEFFFFQLPLALRKIRKKEKEGIIHQVEGELLKQFLGSLPFKLTSSQEKVLDEIKQDMSSLKAMQRLLQGDVGSGKTIIATIASIIAIQGGYQSAIMAPTEILAKQHFEKISLQLERMQPVKKIKAALLTGSQAEKEKDDINRKIAEGEVNLVIGTHALLEKNVQFRNLGLVVIDEQHKFGVGQRALLPEKGKNPDVLIMTATPIPRTLAITIYGDLDISVITELPPGRKKISTQWIQEDKRIWLYDFIKLKIKEGRQAYMIYPIIEISEKADLLSAKKMFLDLKEDIFKEMRLGLIHGRLKSSEANGIMQKFKRGQIDILIATTVLEVGIDIPNASVMVVENAERFGLSQLHQLRGRIGRGEYDSFCILVSNADSQEARVRLETMVLYTDGFKIAEKDLKIRGPGEFFGQRQHGLTELKIGDPVTQLHLLNAARKEAVKLITSDFKLEMRQHQAIKERLLKRFPEYEKFILTA